MNKSTRTFGRLGMVGAAILLTLSVSACGSSTSSPSKESGPSSIDGYKTLHFYGLATTTWADTLDPDMVTDAVSGSIINMIYAGLVKLNPQGVPVPDLAKAIKISSNHLVYTFTLRPGLKFSNGDPVTAQDFVWSYQRALAKSTASAVGLAYLGNIIGAADYNSGKAKSVTGLKVLSPTKLQITINKPIAFFLRELSYETGDVLDPKVLTGKTPGTYVTNACSANVVTGPFEFKCLNNSTAQTSFYPSGETHAMSLVPNPNYYGKKPHISLYMPVIATVQANYQDYVDGGIDVTYIPTPQISANQGKPGFIQFPSSQVDYITPNMADPPFNNVHCRLAVSQAIDRDAITQKILHGAESTTYVVVPRGMLGYYPGLNNPQFDQTQAKSQLSQCNGGNLSFTIAYPKNSADLDNEYRALQGMWTAVGIKSSIDGVPYNQWLKIVGASLKGTPNTIASNGWVEDYPDPYDYCTLLLGAGQNYNIGDFQNAQYNQLVNQAAVEANETQRATMYRQAQHIAVSQGAWIPIGNDNGYAIVNPKVHGFIGVEAFSEVIPKGNDWSNITISS